MANRWCECDILIDIKIHAFNSFTFTPDVFILTSYLRNSYLHPRVIGSVVALVCVWT